MNILRSSLLFLAIALFSVMMVGCERRGVEFDQPLGASKISSEHLAGDYHLGDFSIRIAKGEYGEWLLRIKGEDNCYSTTPFWLRTMENSDRVIASIAISHENGVRYSIILVRLPTHSTDVLTIWEVNYRAAEAKIGQKGFSGKVYGRSGPTDGQVYVVFDVITPEILDFYYKAPLEEAWKWSEPGIFSRIGQ